MFLPFSVSFSCSAIYTFCSSLCAPLTPFVPIEGTVGPATVPCAAPVVVAGPASATPPPPPSRCLRPFIHRSAYPRFGEANIPEKKKGTAPSLSVACVRRSPPPQSVLWIALFILIEGSASAATVPGAGPVVLAGPASATPPPPLALRQLRLSVHRSG